jgi:anti-sigma regulatory factor (Ser/Thr protein kinase)
VPFATTVRYRQRLVRATETRHDLLVYDADETFIVQVVGYLASGLEAGDSVHVSVTPAKQAMLRRTLAADADQISFLDADAFYARPEDAMAHCDAALPLPQDALDQRVRIYGELPIIRRQVEWAGWITYESIVNRAFADRGATLMCGYDARVVPAQIIEQMRRAHRVVHDGAWHLSQEYEEPEELVRSIEPSFEPLPGLRSLEFQASSELQERLARELSEVQMPPSRARDLLVAAREVLGNAERYGNGVRSLRVGAVDDRFVCEVTDAGDGLDDPLAGYLPPRPLGADPAGLWIARQLTSRLELHTAPDGLTVRLWG